MHVLSLPPAFVLSQDQTLKLKPPKGFLTSNLAHLSPASKQVIIRSSFYRSSPTNSEADTWIIAFATRPICKSLDRMTTEPPAYLFRYPSMSKSKRTKITITTSTRRHNRHPIPRMSPGPTALPSTAFPAPPAFPPSVKRCLGPRTNTRNKKMTSPHEKRHRWLIMNDFY